MRGKNNHRGRHTILSALLFFFLLLDGGVLFALPVPQLKGRVNDYASMISAQAEAKLENRLADLERSDSTQFVMLTVPSLEGEILEEYTIRVAEAWKIGQKGFDNGVILFAAKKERKLRIEVGYGLEGRLTDLLAGRIIDHEITPLFRKGRFDDGFSRGADAIIAAIRGEYKASQNVKKNEGRFKLGPFLFVSFFITLFSLDIKKRLLRAIFMGFLIPSAALFFFSPFGVITYLLIMAGAFILGLILPYSDVFSIGGGGGGRPRGGGSYYGSGGWGGGGGFGDMGGGSFGGGGGSFGGGGASGGW